MASRQRYQKGSLLKKRRTDGQTEWILRYRVTSPDGHRVQRQAVVGTTEKYKTQSQANRAADQLRLMINNATPAAQVPTVGLVAAHFKRAELVEGAKRRSWSTRTNYRNNLDLYVLPRWESTPMMDVESPVVETWLENLRGVKKKGALADPTKLRVKNVFSVLFTHAQRYKFVPIGHNPIKLVRQSGKRASIPDILEPGEINALWYHSAARERAAISLEYGNGYRISEPFAMRWSDLDFEKGIANVVRGVVSNHIGDVKTEVSRKPVPLHPYQIEDLKAWRAVSKYNADTDWIFASARKKGEAPLWSNTILDRKIRPLAAKLGIKKKIGWHTFRRTFTSLLASNKENVAIVQQLARHANPTTTFGLYVQAVSDEVRTAQGKVVEMVRNAPRLEAPEAQEDSVRA
jgi:integrase